MARIHLVASPDDYLLQERLHRVLDQVRSELEGVEPEFLPDDVTPESVALELCSPSLFAPQRLLVVVEAGSWLASKGRRSKAAGPSEAPEAVDVSSLTSVLGEGIPEQMGLVMAAVCASAPKGPLAQAVKDLGHLHWHPLPPPPKPWEEVAVSPEQAVVLREVMRRAVGAVEVEPAAEQLLFERLGFAPRLLATEARKLAAAAEKGRVDVALVRRLSFPSERSMEAARDAVFERRPAPLLDLLLAAEGGQPVRDFQGRLMDGKGVAFSLVAQVWSLFQQLLYLRRLADRHGLLDEMAPQRTSGDYWYPRRFKNGILPKLEALLAEDAPSPVVRPGGRSPKPFALSHLFRAAGRYRDDELERALGELGALETALRGDRSQEAVSAFFSRVLPPPGRAA